MAAVTCHLSNSSPTTPAGKSPGSWGLSPPCKSPSCLTCSTGKNQTFQPKYSHHLTASKAHTTRTPTQKSTETQSISWVITGTTPSVPCEHLSVHCAITPSRKGERIHLEHSRTAPSQAPAFDTSFRGSSGCKAFLHQQRKETLQLQQAPLFFISNLWYETPLGQSFYSQVPVLTVLSLILHFFPARPHNRPH